MDRLSASLGVVGLNSFLLVLIVFGMALVEPRFYGLPNLFNILRNTSFLAIMACGQMLVMIVGGMDLSVGATAALASVVAAKVMSSATEAYGFDPQSLLPSVFLPASAARLDRPAQRVVLGAVACAIADCNPRHAVDCLWHYVHDDQWHSGVRPAADVHYRFRPRFMVGSSSTRLYRCSQWSP